MKPFILSLLFRIPGIGAASGLFVNDDSIFLVSDSSSWLFEYDRKTGHLERTTLTETDIPENIPKKRKPDFEAIASFGDQLYVFGSGATENRNKMVIVDIHSKKVRSINDLSDLYETMCKVSGIPAADFNIEGAINTGNLWYFFQRGNGLTGKNGLFAISGNLLGDNLSVSYHEITLPKINGITATFTDAVLADGHIYFLATAENSQSVYDDGEVVGSLIGRIDPESLSVGFTEKITDTQKFEGITFIEQTDREITFLLCEDNDTEVLESGIYQLSIPKK